MKVSSKNGKPQSRNERHGAAWGKPLALLALILAGQFAFAQVADEAGSREPLSPRITAELNHELLQARQGDGGDATVKVIVQYKKAPRKEALARLQNQGAQLNRKLDVVRGAAFSLPVNTLASLENDPEVEYVSVDHPLKGMDDYTNDAMNVSAAWNAGYNGAGIGVAVIDSGINPNSYDFYTFSSPNQHGPMRVVYHQDFTGASEYTATGGLVYDTYGHGTHVAGIIGGNGHLSGGQYSGVAPMANLIDLRVLDGNGNGNDSEVIAALQEAIALKKKYNIKVINLSLGRGIAVPYAQDPLCQAVESAWGAGIVVIAAAGNYGRLSLNGSGGYGTITAPGNDPLVITVGAMKSEGTLLRTDDQIASYSSKGPTTFDHVVKPDIVAPGNSVVSIYALGSTLETGYPGNSVSGQRANQGPGGAETTTDYFMLSGTSMATPAAAGAVALLLQAEPKLTPDQVKARLMQTAYKTFPVSSAAVDPTTGISYTSYYDIFTIGAGYLDVQAALASSGLAPSNVGAALSPAVNLSAQCYCVALSNGNSQIAGSSVVWGSGVFATSVVWGGNVAGTAVIWGTSVVWGTAGDSGFDVVWSSTSTAATSVVWGAMSLDSQDEAFVEILGEQ
jgi:serine protease AprX